MHINVYDMGTPERALVTFKKKEMVFECNPDLLVLALKNYYYKNNGQMTIQDAFPFLNADEREFLLTGTTPDEWDKLFAK